MLRKKRTVKKSIISLILVSLLILVGSILLHNVRKANAEEGSHTVTLPDGTQVVYAWDNTEMIQISFDPITNDMIITGQHNTASNATIYRTNGFTITKGRANKKVTSYSGGKTYIYKGQGMAEESTPIGEITYSTYTINRDVLMESLVSDLGYTSAQLKSGVKVYLSNIFRLGKRVNGVSYDISTYDYKNYKDDSTGKGIADAVGWGAITLDYLKNYYDIEVTVRIVPALMNKYSIVYVDSKDENKILKTVSQNKDIIYKEKYTHTPPEKVTADGSEYVYASKYKVVYENGKSTTNSNWPLSSGAISVTHNQTSNAILKVFYKENETNNPFDIILSFVDETGREIASDVNLGKHYKNKKFSYTSIKSPITYKKKKYEYDYKWSYSFLRADNKTISKDEISDPNYPYLSSLPDVKKGYSFYITLHYKEGAGDVIITPVPGTPTPTPTPTPEIPPVEVPISETVEEPFTEGFSTGVIRADDRGAEKFVATLGVPTTESLYGEVIGTEYLLGYRLTKKVGVKTYPVTVKKDYILEWDGAEGSDGKVPKLTETVSVEQIIEVERAFGYWQIEWLDFYTIKSAELFNYALPNEKLVITPNSTYYSTPFISYTHSPTEESHIIEPRQVKQGIILAPEVISGTEDKPNLPEEDFTFIALEQTDQIKVRSDYLSFNGNVVISNEIREIEAPDIIQSNMRQCDTVTNNNVLYKNNLLIDAIKYNGTYVSNGVLHYEGRANVNSRYGNTVSININNLNDVVIHTPVYCDASIVGDNDRYVQLINPNSNSVQLVLDEDNTLNDMVLSISNTGTHSNKQGYYYRDFSKSLKNPNVSYIASKDGVLRNEVKFPFDVYLDIGNDNNSSNDTFIEANTWVTIGRSSIRVYLPLWVAEGLYKVEFRTVAVNVNEKIDNTESIANTNLYNYVATDVIDVEVSGRIYGLTLYDISDYPLWEEVFRVKNSTVLKRNTSALKGIGSTNYNSSFVYDYAVGTQNHYGMNTTRNAKFTVPLVSGSHPKYANMGILKPGYTFRYNLNTIGSYFNDAAYVKIKPLFYYVDADGKNRVSVDLYYDEEIYGKSKKLVKISNNLDRVNIKSVKTGDAYLAIPKSELEITAGIRGTTYSNWFSQRTGMFNFNEIKLTAPFRTYTNTSYANVVIASNQYNAIRTAGISKNTMIRTKQSFYGEYFLPANIHAVEKGYDVYSYASKHGINYKESFWKKDGYIIVNFDIVAVDNNGNERLSYLNSTNYINSGHCSMWVMEGGIPSKTDNNNTVFNFKAGDFILYNTNQSIKNDYSIGGTH